MTAHNDLAAGGLIDTMVYEQFYLGEKEIVTNQGVMTGAAATKYQLLAKLADTTLIAFVPGTHTIPQAVIAMQPGIVGAHIPFLEEGYVNAAMVTVAAGDGSLNTAVKLKGAFNGQSGIKFGILSPGA